ncbi:UNVERIFIED_CONTAM: hypothetical protein FKN15_068247 [Acipenser sinensis]
MPKRAFRLTEEIHVQWISSVRRKALFGLTEEIHVQWNLPWLALQQLTQGRKPDSPGPTTKDRKAKGSVFSKSLIPEKRRASFPGNTIESFQLKKLSINTLNSTHRSYRTVLRRKKRNGFLWMAVLSPWLAGPSASSQEGAYQQLWYRELNDTYPMGRHIPYLPPGASVPRCTLSPWYFSASVHTVLDTHGAWCARCTRYVVQTVPGAIGVVHLWHAVLGASGVDGAQYAGV